jgi:hypothetical protein
MVPGCRGRWEDRGPATAPGRWRRVGAGRPAAGPMGSALRSASSPPACQRACQRLAFCRATPRVSATSAWERPAANNSTTGLRVSRRCRVRRASPSRGAGFVEAQPVGAIGDLDDREAGKRAQPSRWADRVPLPRRDVHLVMRQRERGASVPLRVLVDGEPPGDDHGLDVDEQGPRPRRRGLRVHIRRGRLLSFVGRQIRAAGRAASDDAGWVALVEDLQQLGMSVGLERAPRVFGQTERIARPSRPADLDHNLHNLPISGDLPEPTVRVGPSARVPAEVRFDLPAHNREIRRTRAARPPGPRTWRCCTGCWQTRGCRHRPSRPERSPADGTDGLHHPG